MIASLHLILQLCFHGVASRSDCPDVLREVSPLLYADQTPADTFTQQLQGLRPGYDSRLVTEAGVGAPLGRRHEIEAHRLQLWYGLPV